MEQNSTTSASAAEVSTAISAVTSETTCIYKNKKDKQSVMKSTGGDKGYRYGGVAVHSQVIKIKQEIEKLKEPSQEIGRLLRDIKRQRSRSPLGIAERAILVGNV